jgi:hypothetical protein
MLRPVFSIHRYRADICKTILVLCVDFAVTWKDKEGRQVVGFVPTFKILFVVTHLTLSCCRRLILG